MTTTERAQQSRPVTKELLDKWALDQAGPVALHLAQLLQPVSSSNGDGSVIFPPTYADIGYNIDNLSSGKKVALIDSVGSQANRMEPLFKVGGPYADLVPQVEIQIGDGTTVSLLDLAHRAADATVHSTPTLSPAMTAAFQALQRGDVEPLCAIAPTSLVFGVWDSRGESGEKRPRLVRSVIRAWDVDVLHAAAQFNSVWKKLDAATQKELEKEGKEQKVKLADRGFKDAPSTFRKTSKGISEFRGDGSPNPEARVLGGILVKPSGRIEREVTVNLVALRGLRGADDASTRRVRQYLLGLSLLAAGGDIDLFLREGCLLRPAATKDAWNEVPRRGDPTPVELAGAQEVVREYTRAAAAQLKGKWPKELRHRFDMKEAKRVIRKGDEEA